jgi:hypothetical protein
VDDFAPRGPIENRPGDSPTVVRDLIPGLFLKADIDIIAGADVVFSR